MGEATAGGGGRRMLLKETLFKEFPVKNVRFGRMRKKLLKELFSSGI